MSDHYCCKRCGQRYDRCTCKAAAPAAQPYVNGIPQFNFAFDCTPTVTQCPRCNNPHHACDKGQAAPAATPEDLAEQYIADQISRAPEPLRRLGHYLSLILDEDEFKTAEKYVLGAMEAAAPAVQPEVEKMRARKDAAYEERNKVVAALARLFPSGIARTAIEGWSDDWHGCVYIDLPTGQVSWHFHDAQSHLFEGLPPYKGTWDGHDTPEKYRRLAALSAATPAARPAPAQPQGALEQAMVFDVCPECNGTYRYATAPAAQPPAQPEGATAPQTKLRGCVKPDTDKQVFFYEQDFYVLSNFSAFALVWSGILFHTSEAAYHWCKFIDRAPEVQDMILSAISAHDAFKIAESRKAQRREDWDAIKVPIMRSILRAKADQHEYVRRKLLATGDRELIEDSWRDDFWGWGPNRDGQNMLGKLWMEIRAELRAGDAMLAAAQEPKQ